MKRFFLFLALTTALFADVPQGLKVNPTTGAVEYPVTPSTFRSGNDIAGAAETQAALYRSAFGPYETKRLFNRLYAASRIGLDQSIETVADNAALAALTVAAGQPNSRYARVTATGGLWMAQATGSGLDKWVPAVAPIIITGDSMGYLKFEPLYEKSWAAHGFGGYMGYLTDYEGKVYPGMRLVGAAAWHNQAAGEGIPSDYAIWINGRWIDLDAAGEGVEFGSLRPGFETSIIKVEYNRVPGGGVFKVQSRVLGGEWTDEVGYTSVSTDGVAGSQALTIPLGTRRAREYRVMWVSGAVKVCLAGGLNESGVQFIEFNYGGILLTDMNRWPVVSATAVLGDLNPCLITHEMKEDASGDYPQDLIDFEALLTDAGVGTDPEDTTLGTTDVLYIGTTPTNNSIENNALLNVVARAHAEAYGRAFIDCLSAGLPWESLNVAFGGAIDGTHLYGAAQSFFADHVGRQLRLFGGPLDSLSPTFVAPKVTDITLADQSVRAALGQQAHRAKQLRGGIVTDGSTFAFANGFTNIGTSDFTLYVWHLVPAIGSGARDFLGLSSSNITTNVASALSASVDQGTDSLLIELRNASNNGTRRISISQYFENYAGQLVMFCLRRNAGRLTVSINGAPLGNNYEYRASATGLGYAGYTESTAGTSPPSFADTIDATALLIFGGTTTRWASPVHEAALYTTAHTDAQVRAYRMTGVPPASPAGLWAFSENAGRYSYDQSGNARNMTTTTSSVQVWTMWMSQYQSASSLRNATLTAYASGTAYTLTNTAAAVDFGTTDPTITINQAGTWAIRARVNLKSNAATIAGETVTLKTRRTNNTAADLTSGSTTVYPPSMTTTTQTVGVIEVPEVIYTTTNTTDVITLYGNVSATLGAGTIDAVEASIVAERLY